MPKYGSFKDAMLNAITLTSLPESAPVWMVCGVDSSYDFLTTHATLEDLGDSVVLDPQEIDNVEWALGLIDGDDELWDHPDSVGLTAEGVVIFLQWAEGTQLVAYTQASEESTLPFTFIDANVSIVWNEAGIIQI